MVSRFGVAADVAIHAPGQEGDHRNWHAHVLTTTRVVTAEGLGAKTRALDVVQTSGPAVEVLRALWAVQVNQALERIQAEARVDHRSFARRGLERDPEQHLGVAASGMERKAARRAAATEAAEVAPLAALPEPAREGPRRAQAGVGSGTGPEPAQEPARPAAARMGEKTLRTAPETVSAVPAPSPTGPTPEGPVRASAGVFGAGAVPATRIGQRNAAIRGQNQAREIARRVLEAAQRALAGLKRAAAAGVRRVLELARGVGVQAVAERDARAEAAIREQAARAQAWAAQLAEMQRASAARLAAEQARIAAERRQREALLQAGPVSVRDAAQAYWERLAEDGRKARQADQEREGQKPKQERLRQRQGPSMGR